MVSNRPMYQNLQMHFAPLGVHARGHIVLADVASHEELDRHDPEQAGEGRDEGQQIKGRSRR